MADLRFIQGSGGAIELTTVPDEGTVQGDLMRERLTAGDLIERDVSELCMYVNEHGGTVFVFADLAPEGAVPAELPDDTERTDDETPVDVPAAEDDVTVELPADELPADELPDDELPDEPDPEA